MSQTNARHQSWTNNELEAAVEAYLYLLKLERSGITLSSRQVEGMAGKGHLVDRNGASIRYRLRNISHILSERGLPVLQGYSPAPAVGKNVREKIENILDNSREFIQLLQDNQQNPHAGKHTASGLVEELENLKSRILLLSDLNQTSPNFGHNNPPEDMRLECSENAEVIEAVRSIQEEVQKKNIDRNKLDQARRIVAEFGLNCVLWMRDRITDFSKAAAIAAGTAYGVSNSGGLPHEISNVLAKISSFLF
ncbi:hypothetical protein HED22_08320 [Thalassospira sp. HF15]|uniref:hypothetical protein n=1 Tax=Thalassospira sp. HF15 TaxID=2722755 RepID=UPI00142FA6E0|nr:hypothetical protein [Thalassospira sp. HF15]NIY75645.1 hypothetical protein [Thalassospira sp. HF15]